jgi:hypothetical protein
MREKYLVIFSGKSYNRMAVIFRWRFEFRKEQIENED